MIFEDLRVALRTLRRNFTFAAISVLTLGLAIGASAGIFTVVKAVILDPLPFPDPDRLVQLSASAPGTDMPDRFLGSWEFYLQFSEDSELLEDVATYSIFTSTLRTGDEVENLPMARATISLFSTLGASPILGRLPTEEDVDDAAVISHGLWTSLFGGDPEIIGRSIQVGGPDGQSVRSIIGIMGEDFRFPTPVTTVWLPWSVTPEAFPEPGLFDRQAMVGRIAPGVSVESLVTELRTLGRQLPERFGGSASYAGVMGRYEPVVRSLEEQLYGYLTLPLWALFGSACVVLLIACANVANLFAVRAERRRREIAVRAAVGARREHLVGSLMAEAAILSAAAGVVAVFIASVGVPALLAAAPSLIPGSEDIAVGAPTVLFVVVVSALAAVVCGLAPAVRSSRPDLSRLRDGSDRSTRSVGWGQRLLVGGQTAFTVILLIGSGLLAQSLWALRQVDPGYDTENVLTFQIAPSGTDLTGGMSYAEFHTGFMDRLAALPGVESVGVVENVPLNEGVRGARFVTDEAGLGGGGGVGQDGGALPASFTWAGGDYFATMGIEVIRGRAFTREDDLGGAGNAIVSESAADLLWPGRDPLGRRLVREGQESWATVVGVVEDVVQYDFREGSQPLVYFPLDAGVIASPAYVVRSALAAELAPRIRELVREVAPSAPMYRVYTMESLASATMTSLSFTALALGISAALALLLATVGLYGVLSYVVTGRTREIGMRMALGARAAQVRAMVVGQGTTVVAVGAVVGAVAAVAATRVLGSLLYGVEAVDGATFAAMSAAMVLVGALASYMPARKASAVDPVECLRGE